MKYLFLILLMVKFAFISAFADVINDVQIKNNNRITKETIITFGGIELGKDYSEDQLNTILLICICEKDLSLSHIPCFAKYKFTK